jgi:hypothetical protein
MKTYEVELRYESYMHYTVEAEDRDQAEELAFDRLRSEGVDSARYGSWDTDSIEEVTP